MTKQEIPKDMRCGECYHMKAWSYAWCSFHEKPVMMFDAACDDAAADERMVEAFRSYKEMHNKNDEDKE